MWPWKEVLDKEIDAHGKEIILLEKSVHPLDFAGEPKILLAVGLAFAGFILIYGIEKWASKMQND